MMVYSSLSECYNVVNSIRVDFLSSVIAFKKLSEVMAFFFLIGFSI